MILLALICCAVPNVAVAEKTPTLDKETDAIKEYLWKKGMSTAPTQMYLAARTELRTEMCGSIKMDDEVKMYLRTATVEAPAEVVVNWYMIFKKKMREVLIANPDEAREFCK